MYVLEVPKRFASASWEIGGFFDNRRYLRLYGKLDKIIDSTDSTGMFSHPLLRSKLLRQAGGQDLSTVFGVTGHRR